MTTARRSAEKSTQNKQQLEICSKPNVSPPGTVRKIARKI